MSKTQSRPTDNFSNLLEEARENFSRDGIGLVLLLVGGYGLFTLFAADIPWIVTITGWTSALVALAFIVTGLVLMLRARVGYWSAEALVGAELVLLTLQACTFTLNHSTVDWTPHFDGRDGGLVGWTIGSILVAALGQWPAFALLLMVGLVGLFLLYRYTPLIYLEAFIEPYVGIVRILWSDVIRGRQAASAELPSTLGQGLVQDASNFVTPQQAAGADDDEPSDEPDTDASPPPFTKVPSSSKPTVQKQSRTKQDKASQPPAKSKPKAKRAPAPKPLRKPGDLPPTDLLGHDDGEYGNADTHELQERIEQTLADFDVPVRVVHVESGPTVTQFGIEPLYLERAGQKRKVRVSRIVNLADDLALALEARSVRIEAPVPGRPYVGIEVPNAVKKMVGLRDILEDKTMRRDGGQLGIGLGRNTAGNPVVIDLVKAPHMLIAGATGAGKSVCINTVIASLLMQHGPESLQFVMVDPKMVELPGYNGIPHLIGKVITEMDQVMGMLTWLLLQMDDRYRAFKEIGARNIDTYNTRIRRLRGKDAPQPLPYIVLIVDELADLMMTAADDIERQICRLAQMARATGIHLILATQRPSTDVVTGLIKANFPTRVAFAVTSQIDSRVIMDVPGAERLLGRGDMLLMRSDEAKLKRVQGCWVADDEIVRITDYWKAQAADGGRPKALPWAGLMDRLEDGDELLQDAMDVLHDLRYNGQTSCSTSLLQRKLRIGYPKAARLMEQLETHKAVGPDMGRGQGRAILLGENEAAADDEVAHPEDSGAIPI